MTNPEYPGDRPTRRSSQPHSNGSYSDDRRYRDYDRRQDTRSYREPSSYRGSDRDYQTYRDTGSHREADRDYRSYRQPQNRTYTSRDYDSPQRRTASSQPRRTQPPRRNTANRRTYSDTPVNNRTYGYDDQPRRQPEYSDRPQRARGNGGYDGRSANAAGIFDSFPWLRWALVAVAALIALFIVVNIASCIGGAITGGQAETSQEATSESTAEGSASESTSGSESASSSSSQAQQGVVSPWTDSGYFTTGDAQLDEYVKKMCDEHSTEGETFDKNAYATFIWLSQDTDYVEREENQSPYGAGWDVEYAKQFFEKGNSGNCFNFVAVCQFMLQYFGSSDAEGQPCVVELESGSWGDHGRVVVTNKVDNKRCLVDVALSSNGWMLDIDAYSYDVRNIEQNPTVKGNANVIDDGPTTIAPGNLTE